MAATVTDKFKKYSDGSDAPNVARVASPRSAAGTTLACDDLTGWATDTAVNFATYELDTADEVVSGSITYWVGVVSGNNLTNVARVKGAADGGNAINDVVAQIPDSDRFDDLVDGLLVSLDQDGTLKAGAVDNAAVLASDVVTTAKILDANVTTAKLADTSVTSEKLNATVSFRGTTTQAFGSATNGTDVTSYTEVYDLGSNFASGVFTAPYAGIYHFDACAGITNKTARIKCIIVKNSTPIAEMEVSGGTTSEDPMASCSVTTTLAASETVKMQSGSPDGAATLRTPSQFSGYLVGRT